MPPPPEFFQTLVEEGPVACIVLSDDAHVRYASPAAARLLETEATGRRFVELFDRDPGHEVEVFVRELFGPPGLVGALGFSTDWTRLDGTKRRLKVQAGPRPAESSLGGIVLVLSDVTVAHGREQALFARGSVDELTGIATRAIFLDRMGVARRNGIHGAAALVDMDMFKRVNDRFGHVVGDAVLKSVATRLAAALPEAATLARFGGDEFAVFLPDTSVHEGEQLLRRAAALVGQPMTVEGQSVAITLSIGLAAAEGEPPENVVRDCDSAMYAAKARGRDRVLVFGPDVRTMVGRRRELAAAVMQLQTENKRLHVQARTDALTSLGNRLALQEIEDFVLGSSSCPWEHAAVVFLDIDHFGAYNHLHTDHAGDEALRLLARVLARCARDSDLVFRKGGEEFVVVLAELGQEAALSAAERMRSSVQALAIAHRGSSAGDVLTVTVGVASGTAGDSIRQLREAAGDLVMSAKNSSRRNLVLHE